MKRIMYVHHSGLIGGAGISLINALISLSSEYEITVCLCTDPDDIIRLIEEKNIPNVTIKKYGRRIGALTYYSGGDSPFSLRFWYRVSLIFRQRKMWNELTKEINPDLVIVNSKILCWMSGLKEFRQRKTLCFVRETLKNSERNIVNRIMRKYLDGFSKVMFLCNYDRDKIKLKKAESEVLYNYLETSQYSRGISRMQASEKLGLSDETYHVLYVGGVSEVKGFDYAVKAALECESDVELIVAGSNFEQARITKSADEKKYCDFYEKYLKENDSDNRIHLVGIQDNMSMCYSACDVLLFPMRAPHQARPAFEAGYFGKPVIISDFDNIREFVSDGDNGYTVNPQDAKAVAEKIMYLKNNPDVAAKLGKNNADRTERNHSKAKYDERLRKTVKELLDK